MQILDIDDIKNRIELTKMISMQEEGFKAFSANKVNIPPVGYIKQKNPPGSYHIKYGLINNDSIWVVKIAGGPHSMPLNGLIIVISTVTGAPIAILKDNGYLTQLRTAIAGLISAKYLAPKKITNIGIVGTGKQAEMQLNILKNLTTCRNVYIWGRSAKKSLQYKKTMEKQGFKINVVSSTTDIIENCNLIVTATSAEEPILTTIHSGTHITAVGADAPGKIELNPKIISNADILCADSKAQCIDHGEIHYAYKEKMIKENNIIELGQLILDQTLGRTQNDQITVTDLTGIAVQDIQIAKAIIQQPCSKP